jgi:hypothetical protein
MFPHLGAAHVSKVSVAGAQMAYDSWVFFNRDPMAMDRTGPDLLEEERADRRLPLIRNISTHMAGCALAGLRTDDPARIHLRGNRNLMTCQIRQARRRKG